MRVRGLGLDAAKARLLARQRARACRRSSLTNRAAAWRWLAMSWPSVSSRLARCSAEDPALLAQLGDMAEQAVVGDVAGMADVADEGQDVVHALQVFARHVLLV